MYVAPLLFILFLTILTGKNCFVQFSTRIYLNRILAASDLFHIFTQSIKSYAFHCHILKTTYEFLKSKRKKVKE